MIRPQLILDVNDELIVDNFAGGGGASTGIELALGRHVDDAINHKWDALGMHRINHPQTVHHCEDVFDIDPLKVTHGRRVGLGWFSPDCRHFSKAKGGKPVEKRIRGLVLIMFRWAAIRTRVMFMENVEEIRTWGPLLNNGKPDPKHKGRTWRAFLDAMGSGLDPDHPDMPEMLEVLGGSVTKEQLVRGFGYSYDMKEIRACDFGAPTIRKRLFAIFRCDGHPIIWPEATHAAPDKITGKQKPWRIIAECIDWDLPCPSIFLTPEQAKAAKCKRPLAKSTLRRIAAGIGRYVIHAKQPFLVNITHGGRVEPIDQPAKTVTGAHRGEKALVNTTVAPFVSDTVNGFGEAKKNYPVDEPGRTQCAEVKGGHFSLVSGSLVGAGGPAYSGKPKPVDASLNTMTTESRFGLATANLVRTAHGEQDKNGKKRGKGEHAADEPLPSALATKDFALVSANLMVNNTHHTGAPSDSPAPTIPTGGHHALIATNLMKFQNDSDGQPMDKPGPTVTANAHIKKPGGAAPIGLCATNLVKFRGDSDGVPMDQPGHTASAGGKHHAVVAASVAAYYGSEADGQGVEEPSRTTTTKPRFGIAMSEAVAPPMTDGQVAGARRVAKFLRDHGVEFEGEFAMVGPFVIVDIGMRMLTPRELFRAQGFPETYVIDRAWVVDPKTGEITDVTLTKEQQIRMCGNSVCPPVAEALVAANVPELSIWNQRERKRSKKLALAA